jgi:hypothetical protein
MSWKKDIWKNSNNNLKMNQVLIYRDKFHQAKI